MKSDALQGQSSLRIVCSATEYVSQDLTLFSRTALILIWATAPFKTLFSRNPALIIDLYPARNSTVSIGIPD